MICCDVHVHVIDALVFDESSCGVVTLPLGALSTLNDYVIEAHVHGMKLLWMLLEEIFDDHMM